MDWSTTYLDADSRISRCVCVCVDNCKIPCRVALHPESAFTVQAIITSISLHGKAQQHFPVGPVRASAQPLSFLITKSKPVCF